ncbi:MAG: hypothetical protein Q7S52_03040, partial [bacterium]|nr:hypothetical protein [bacterium]
MESTEGTKLSNSTAEKEKTESDRAVRAAISSICLGCAAGIATRGISGMAVTMLVTAGEFGA